VTYVYCLVRSARKPSLRRVTGGLPGAGPVRALDAGRGLWVIASDVPEREYNERAIADGLTHIEWVSQRAMAHEAIVERFLGAPALLPMQLFTIFTSDERALAHVSRERRRIEPILRRVGGHLEWGVRLTWDEEAARAEVERSHRRTAGREGSGSAYLARKRDLLDVGRTRLADARAEATALHRDLAALARDAFRRTSTERAAPGSRLLLDAAYLVRAARRSAFQSAVRRHARRLAARGIAATLTGPWPPYNFISGR
jgi:hypothetical protein